MRILRTDFYADPNLGLFGFATDKYCLLGPQVKKKKIEEVLKVPVRHCTISNTDLLGIFCAGNSYGIALPHITDKHEKEKFKEIFEHVLVLKSRYTALGNLILLNDNGIIISKFLRKEKMEIEDFFGMRCEVSTIASLNIVGALGIATNKGCLLTPKARKKEIELIEGVLDVKADIGTVNFGSPFPKSGLIVNTNGVAMSQQTSGPEMQRITEVFGFI